MKIILFIITVFLFVGCTKEKREIVKFFPDKVGTKWIYLNSLTNDTFVWEIIDKKNVYNFNCFVIRTNSKKNSAYTDYYYAFDYEGLYLVGQSHPSKKFIIKNDSIIVGIDTLVYNTQSLFLKYPQIENSSWDLNTFVFEDYPPMTIKSGNPIKMKYGKRKKVIVKYGTFDCITVQSDSLKKVDYYSNIGLVMSESKLTINNELINVKLELIDYK